MNHLMRNLTQDELRAVLAALGARAMRFHTGLDKPAFVGEVNALGAALGKFQRDFERRVIHAGEVGDRGTVETLTKAAPLPPRPLSLEERMLQRSQKSLAAAMGLNTRPRLQASSLRRAPRKVG